MVRGFWAALVLEGTKFDNLILAEGSLDKNVKEMSHS